mgnify:FL=1
MKKVIFIMLLVIPILLQSQQSEYSRDLYCFELQVEGLNNWDKGDYLVRSLEKMDLIIFGSFDIENQQVYALLKDKSQMPNIINYIDNAINGYKLISYKEEVMTDDLFLKIYELRNGVGEGDIVQREPVYIQLGPKNELSKELYDRAKTIWSQKYQKEQKINGKIDFADKGRINEYYRAIFEIDKQVDAQMLEEIHNALKESEKITDVNRCGDGCFEIYAYEEIYPKYVEDIILQYGVNISERSLIEKK